MVGDRTQCLSLDNTAVSDRGLARLKDLSTLRELYIAGTFVSEQGCQHWPNPLRVRGNTRRTARRVNKLPARRRG